MRRRAPIAAALLGCVLLLAVLALEHTGTELELRLVVSQRESNPFAKFLGTEPRFTECAHCTPVDLSLGDLGRQSVVAESVPRVRMGRRDLESVEVTENRQVLPPFEDTWEVLVKPSASGRDLLMGVASDFPQDLVLVSINGEPAYVHQIWIEGIWVGRFRSPAPARALAESFALPVAWHPLDESQWERDKADVSALLH